jgi:rod shape-determining protein MreD
MRWLIFSIFAFVLLALEIGLRNLLHVEIGGDWVSPSFVLVLLVFVSIWAPPRVALWSGLILGALLDLAPQSSPTLPAGFVLLGPAALGGLLAAYAVVQLRGLVYRESPLAAAVLVFVAGIFMHLMIVAVLSFRGVLYHPLEGWTAAGQLFHRFWILLYSAVLALPLGYALTKTLPMWGFESVKSSRRV